MDLVRAPDGGSVFDIGLTNYLKRPENAYRLSFPSDRLIITCSPCLLRRKRVPIRVSRKHRPRNFRPETSKTQTSKTVRPLEK